MFYSNGKIYHKLLANYFKYYYDTEISLMLLCLLMPAIFIVIKS